MPVSKVMEPGAANRKLTKMPVEQPASASARVAMIMSSAPVGAGTGNGTAHGVAKTARPRQKIAPARFVQRNESPPAQLTKPPVRANKKPVMASEPKKAEEGKERAPSAGGVQELDLDPSDVTNTAPIFDGSPIKALKPPVRPVVGSDAFAARKAMLEADATDVIACFIARTEGHCRKNQVGKVVFDISGMEFPKDVTVVQLESYFYGKSYRRACIKAGADQYDFAQHEPWVVTHKFNSKFLFCTITSKTFPRTVDNIEQHTRGAKYTRGLKIKQAEMAERKRVAEKRRRNKVKERTAMANAKKMEKDEYTIKVANYNSEEDDDFNPNAPADEDEQEQMAADHAMEDVDDDEDLVDDPLTEGLGTGKKSKRITKATPTDMDTAETRPHPNNLGDTNMNIAPDIDCEAMDADALPWIAPRQVRPPAPARRSKTKAVAVVSEEAPQLGSDDSSDDEDFAPVEDGGYGSDDGESGEGGEGPLENAIESGGADEDSDDDGAPSNTPSEVEHKEEWGIHKQYNEDVYVGPPKPEPVVPVNPAAPMNFARVRAQIRAKKRTKQALKKEMARSARQRSVIQAAKEELRAEAEKDEGEDEDDDGFWTRGKHDVKLEDVRSKVNFTIDEMDDDEWNRNFTGAKRKRNAKPARKSRQDRLRRVMGGAGAGSGNNSNTGSS